VLVLLRLRRVRVWPGYLFELHPFLAVLAGEFLRDYKVAFADVILG